MPACVSLVHRDCGALRACYYREKSALAMASVVRQKLLDAKELDEALDPTSRPEVDLDEEEKEEEEEEYVAGALSSDVATDDNHTRHPYDGEREGSGDEHAPDPWSSGAKAAPARSCEATATPSRVPSTVNLLPVWRQHRKRRSPTLSFSLRSTLPMGAHGATATLRPEHGGGRSAATSKNRRLPSSRPSRLPSPPPPGTVADLIPRSIS